MDATRFDILTKAWGSVPRRRVLGGFAVGALGPLLGLSVREASALSCRRSRQCPTREACVNRICALKCVNGEPFECGGGTGFGCPGGCYCGKKPGGGKVCVQGGGICAGLEGCTKQGQCPSGQLCVSGCCGDGVPRFTCQPPCVV